MKLTKRCAGQRTARSGKPRSSCLAMTGRPEAALAIVDDASHRPEGTTERAVAALACVPRGDGQPGGYRHRAGGDRQSLQRHEGFRPRFPKHSSARCSARKAWHFRSLKDATSELENGHPSGRTIPPAMLRIPSSSPRPGPCGANRFTRESSRESGSRNIGARRRACRIIAEVEAALRDSSAKYRHLVGPRSWRRRSDPRDNGTGSSFRPVGRLKSS